MKKFTFLVAAVLTFAAAPCVAMAAPAAMAVQAASDEADVEDYSIDWTEKDAHGMWTCDDARSYISVDNTNGLTIQNPSAKENWQWQMEIAQNIGIEGGKDYTILVEMKGTAAGHADLNIGTWGANMVSGIDFTDQWQTYECKITSNANSDATSHILLQFGQFVGTVYIKSVKVVHSEKVVPHYEYGLISTDFSADGAQAIGGWGNGFSSEISDGVNVIKHGTGTTNTWDVQACLNGVYPKGATVKLTMEAKGSVDGSIAVGLQNPEGYKGCGDFPAINLTTDYQKFEVSTTCSGEAAQRLLLNLGAYQGEVSIKNIKVELANVKQETVTISPSSFATYAAYYPVDYAAQNLKAYAVKLNDAKTGVEFTELTGVVPAGTPVLLNGEANAEVALEKAEGWNAVDTDLKMSDGTATTTATAVAYALSTVGDVTAFYPVKKDSKITAKHCYLVAPVTASQAAFFSIDDLSGETTGISSVVNSVEKADGPMFNLAGQVVGKGYKGLVIKNGKKIIIK